MYCNAESACFFLQAYECLKMLMQLYISSICKLYSMLVMAPGSLERGVVCVPMHVLSILDSQSWIMPRMKTKVLCAVVFLAATLAQSHLLYHSGCGKVISNDQLFFGVPSYPQELLSLSSRVLEGIVNIVMQEPSKAVRGKIALEVCNCIASVFMVGDEILAMCSELVEIARTCLSAGDKFLQSTLTFLDARQFHS